MKKSATIIAWITGLLALIIILVMGTIMYVRIAYSTLPDNNTTDIGTTSAPLPATTPSASSQQLDAELSGVDAELEAYANSTTDVDAAINDEQEDLSE